MSATNAATPQTVAVNLLPQHLQQHPDTLLIDVRDHADHAAVRLPGSLCVPLADLQQQASIIVEHSGNAERPVLLICMLGKRGQMAADHLQQHINNPLFVLEGGLNACVELGVDLIYGGDQ